MVFDTEYIAVCAHLQVAIYANSASTYVPIRIYHVVQFIDGGNFDRFVP